MRLFRWLAGGLLTAIVITAAVWLSTPWWLARIAQCELESLGYSEVTVEIGEIGLRQGHITQLHLRDRRDGLELKADNATLSYNLTDLLRQRLESLNLEALTISMQISRKQGAGTLVLASPAVLFAQLPVGRMEISRLTLRQLDHRQYLQRKLSGSLHYDEQSAALRLQEERGKAGLQAELMLNRQGDCRARLTQAEKEILRIQCQLQDEAERMAFKGELKADLGELEKLMGDPAEGLSGELKTTWNAHLPHEVADNQLLEALAAEARFDLAARLNAHQPLELSLQGTAALEGGQVEWTLADGSELRFGKKLASRLTVSDAAGTIGATDRQLTLASGSKLRLSNYRNGDIAIGRTDLRLAEPLTLSFADPAAIMLSQPASFALGETQVRQKKNRVHLQDAAVVLKPGSLFSPAGNIKANGLRYESEAANLPAAAMAADFNLSDDLLSAHGTLSAESGKLYLKWSLKQNIGKNSGRVEFSARPLQFPTAWPVVTRIVPIDEPLELHAGSLAGRGNLSWSGHRPLGGNVDVELAGINALYGETAILGLSGKANAHLSGNSLQIRSDDLRLAELNPGVALTNIGLQAAVDLPAKGPVRLLLTGLRAEALGGTLSSNRIDIETGRASNPFLVQLKGIDAGQLAEFRRQEGLSAEGKLDGELPFDWTDKGLKMTAGNLAARTPGGLIRYLGTSSIQQMAESEQTMQMAMQILSDFHFKVLELRADYQPDGQLALHVELKGNNPAYEKGRPIEFNLNIEENVLKLLQSLRMADEISGKLEKKVQKKMQKR